MGQQSAAVGRDVAEFVVEAKEDALLELRHPERHFYAGNVGIEAKAAGVKAVEAAKQI